MNMDAKLRLQAYVDGELPASQADQIRDWLAGDAAARELVGELERSSSILKRNELPAKLPVSPDFYWTQIKQRIEQVEAAPSTVPSPRITIGWIWKWLVPISGMALIVLSLLSVRPHATRPQPSLAAWSGTEVESAIPDSDVVTFRSDTEGISVVWMNIH